MATKMRDRSETVSNYPASRCRRQAGDQPAAAKSNSLQSFFEYNSVSDVVLESFSFDTVRVTNSFSFSVP